MRRHPSDRLRFDLREVNGALGDLGTLLPLTIGAIAIVGLSATQVLLGFGLFYIATGLIYRLPVPVQPMKAIVAVALVAEISPASIALSGMLIGLALLLLGGTGVIDRIARLVPQSVLTGLQLGLGLGLAWISLGLMAGQPLIGLLSLGLAAAALRLGTHAALMTLGFGVAAGHFVGHEALPDLAGVAAAGWLAPVPSLEDMRIAITDLALPQLALTLTNAVILTAIVARDSYGARAARVTPKRLCLTSGVANLALSPFGALPMCHGAGGVAAHHRFGARSGGAPVMLGAALLLVALLPQYLRHTALLAIPSATLGALLLVAAVELAANRRLFDARPSCRPVIAVTALATFLGNPLIGLILGTLAEVVRKAVLAHLSGRKAEEPE
ncbi:putative sulfate/molybdate transporter [Roseovarius atlanticus]|uniref:putative sulfate/molybdate transporter n=1 Tax=Roseovarius atlanticus TaxID=1641875 RepID=UPI001C95016A|nr:putative sulfate/molybdate transporter [Roseovarius atlanticus]MBY5987032.1 putative sulfate/molybdate transporter [Roseovarius atlanticus]MBY6125672.1 putative sulfate/molybdate transporter [Roseovarius atlanticus]MBY6149867.1 putative sulfate/molybdate transporter [Roseovarius atlanticus]